MKVQAVRSPAPTAPRHDAPKVPARPRRGRPPGSPSLTTKIEDTIVSFVASGATLAAAAAAAGISPRTLRDWLSRGEDRHSSRQSTPRLRRFAIRLRRAQAEARILAENRVFKENPRAWLSRTARSSADDDGWSDAPTRGGDSPGTSIDLSPLSEEELDEALRRLLDVVKDRPGATGHRASRKGRS